MSNNILIIATPEDQSGFIRILGDGKEFGVNLSYAVQPSPDGLAQAFIIGSPYDKDVILKNETKNRNIIGKILFLGDSMYDHQAANTAKMDL